MEQAPLSPGEAVPRDAIQAECACFSAAEVVRPVLFVFERIRSMVPSIRAQVHQLLPADASSVNDQSDAIGSLLHSN